MASRSTPGSPKERFVAGAKQRAQCSPRNRRHCIAKAKPPNLEELSEINRSRKVSEKSWAEKIESREGCLPSLVGVADGTVLAFAATSKKREIMKGPVLRRPLISGVKLPFLVGVDSLPCSATSPAVQTSCSREFFPSFLGPCHRSPIFSRSWCLQKCFRKVNFPDAIGSSLDGWIGSGSCWKRNSLSWGIRSLMLTLF